MNKCYSLFLIIFLAGCTVTMAPLDNTTGNNTMSWCEEGTINITILTETRTLVTSLGNIKMPNNEVVMMCCVETLSDLINTTAKICAVNPEQYDNDVLWGYAESEDMEGLIKKTYTYINNSQACIEVYTDNTLESANCQDLN